MCVRTSSCFQPFWSQLELQGNCWAQGKKFQGAVEAGRDNALVTPWHPPASSCFSPLFSSCEMSAASKHPQREGERQHLGQLSVRSRGVVQLQSRLFPAGQCCHQLHGLRDLEPAPPAVQRWVWFLGIPRGRAPVLQNRERNYPAEWGLFPGIQEQGPEQLIAVFLWFCVPSKSPLYTAPISEIRCEFPDVQGVKKAIKGNTYRSGTNITLECDDGYTLEGIRHTQCQEDFSWDPPVPACKLSEWNANKAKNKPKYECVFEHANICVVSKRKHTMVWLWEMWCWWDIGMGKLLLPRDPRRAQARLEQPWIGESVLSMAGVWNWMGFKIPSTQTIQWFFRFIDIDRGQLRNAGFW